MRTGKAVNGTWAKLSPETIPPPTRRAGICTDPTTGQVILFGGENASPHSGAYSKTWIFDGKDWHEVAVGDLGPRVTAASAATDPSTGNAVLFGGFAVHSRLEELWSFLTRQRLPQYTDHTCIRKLITPHQLGVDERVCFEV